MNPLRIFLVAALILVVVGSMKVVAERPALSSVGSYDTDSYALGVAISGDYAYIADYENGLIILNIEEPSNPVFSGSYDTDGLAYRVTISGNYAYVADWNNGLIILNIEDPSNPIFVGSYDAKPAWSVTISGNYGYVSACENGLIILDIEDPSNPTFVGSYDTESFFRETTISGNYVYIADQNEGLVILNIEDPSTPTFVGSYDTELYGRDVTISGDYAYVAGGGNGLFVILNIEDPFNPTFVGNYNTTGPVNDVVISGNYAYVADYWEGLVTINIEDRSNPTFVRNYDISGASDVIISENFVYLANTNGLVILYENPAEYSVTFTDDIVHLDVSPGDSGIGCTDMVISNLGTITIDVDVSLSGDNVTISPGAVSVTIEPGGNQTIPMCALALTRSEARIVQVSAFASGRETNTQLNQVQVMSKFIASIDPYARLSIQTQIAKTTPHCIGSTFWTNFSLGNNGNADDNIFVELNNRQELEDAGFKIIMPRGLYQQSNEEPSPTYYHLLGNGEYYLLPLKVVAEDVTPGIYNMTVKISTTMEGETENRTVTATVNMTNCQAKPVALAGKDITVKEGEVVQFSGAGTRVNGSIVFYEWDFDGDGVFEWSSEDNGVTTFLYNDGGEYTTTFRVTDNEGYTAIDNRTITVSEEPLAGQCTCPDGSKGQMVGPADDDGVDDGCLCDNLGDDDQTSTPSISLITSLISIGLLAIFRRK